MNDMLKVLTWNIGGAHVVNSSAAFDYGKEDASYFATAIKAVSPDIVCLQESHTNDNDVLADQLASELGLSYVFDAPRSPSHIDANYRLSNAIISRYPINDTKNIQLPYPPFELHFKNGKAARRFDTYLQTCRIQGALVANIHLQPLHRFGYSYSEDEGRTFASSTEKVLCDNLTSPLIFAGDFNDPELFGNFPQLIEKFSLSAALDDQPTDSSGNKINYILFSDELTLENAELIKTNRADHHIGWAELTLIELHRDN